MSSFSVIKNGENTGVVTPRTGERYLALDVLRGLTIALMILVNTPGSWSTIYAPFRHAAWHGFTITDLVFPSFLFVVGNAMSFSMRKFDSQPDAIFWKKVLKRTFLIFVIGLFLNAFPFVHRAEGEIVLKDLSNIRIMGVLQRIALCYFFASVFIKYFKLKGSAIISVIILLLYWGLMYYFGDAGDPYSKEGNAALKFDRLILPAENLYTGFGLPFDPEGLLSTLPAIVNVIAGYLAGIFIQKSGNNFTTVMKLIAAGLVCVLIGEIWDMVFPINKPIWTSSYVMLSVGWSLVLIGALIWIIEVVKLKRWTYFFEVFGKNPLFIYVMSGVFVMLLSVIWINGGSLKGWLYDNFFLSWLEPYNASLFFAVIYVLLLWLMGYWMDKKKIYIKV
ncbi:acyltransferase family protein [Salinimicrobium xinjiangense]|uniref:acyltransferase family protein n=1 Tax=Salinimicrobium xinjiangense TaxID=438596 RepID=UPI0003FBEFA9|nr:heparan-alpha-glucosaminide N-acetyltransferase domain-containing protein [Salinimicrobium xinjiangense]